MYQIINNFPLFNNHTILRKAGFPLFRRTWLPHNQGLANDNVKYCDVFGRMPSLLCNRKLNTSINTLTTRYCHVAWLPSNRGRVFPLGQPDVVRGRQCTTVSLSLRRSVFGVSQSLGSEWVSVYASAWVSLHQWVSGIRIVQCSKWIIEGGSQCLEDFQ
jgi:hypothetical protein